MRGKSLDQLQWAAEGVAALWPPGSVILTRRRLGPSGLLVLPSVRRPRMLVPTGMPGAEVMLRRHVASARQRWGQRLLAGGIRLRLLEWLPFTRLVLSAGGGIDEFVRSHVPAAARVGILLGPPRVNAKPVLQVFDRSGRTIAFGKVGHGDYTTQLVRRESATLEALRGHAFVHIEFPAPIYCGPWQGLELLLMTAAPASQGRGPDWNPPMAAMRELAEHAGVDHAAVGASAYWADLSRRMQKVHSGAAVKGESLLDSVSHVIANVDLAYGSWHGDWAPWNSRRGSDRIALWDWERSGTVVPLGFDTVHFLLQREFRMNSSAAQATTALMRDLPPLLDLWYRRQEQVAATVVLYLLEMTHRYLDIGDQTSTVQIGSRLITMADMVRVVLQTQLGGTCVQT